MIHLDASVHIYPLQATSAFLQSELASDVPKNTTSRSHCKQDESPGPCPLSFAYGRCVRPCHRAIVGSIRETTCFRRMSDRVIPSVIVIVAFVESIILVFSLGRYALLLRGVAQGGRAPGGTVLRPQEVAE